MRIAIRADSGTTVGGGHVMRCLSLAGAAQAAGHEICFVCANVAGHLGSRIEAAGHPIYWLDHEPEQPAAQGTVQPIENWRPMSPTRDSASTCEKLAAFKPDWVILDHYGLDGTWVQALRATLPDLRILALDDLDRTPLFADLLLNPAAVPGVEITQPHMAMLKGPAYALLRPEFIDLRPTALSRHQSDNTRRQDLRPKVLILPGMSDAMNFAPIALEAMRAFPDMQVDVIMGSQSPSRSEVERLIRTQDNWQLILDATDMAQRMAEADLCIGAGGVSAWERCCLGLPAVNVALTDNQKPGVQALAEAGAAIALDRSALQNPIQLSDGIRQILADHRSYSANAAALCDGHGAARVIAALSGQLRPVTLADAQLIFDWRNQPHIRAASLNPDPLIWDNHLAYLTRVLEQPDTHCWRIYQEDGVDLGLVNAQQAENGQWTWGFYIGASKPPKGAGRRMLAQFLRHISQIPGFTGVKATVLATNERSLALHEALGFRDELQVGFPADLDKPAAEIQYHLNATTLQRRLGTGLSQ